MSALAVTAAPALPPVRGSLEANGSLADFIWFRTGGPAEWIFRPADVDDLAAFLTALPGEVHHRRTEEVAHHRSVPMHQVRTVLSGMQV